MCFCLIFRQCEQHFHFSLSLLTAYFRLKTSFNWAKSLFRHLCTSVFNIWKFCTFISGTFQEAFHSYQKHLGLIRVFIAQKFLYPINLQLIFQRDIHIIGWYLKQEKLDPSAKSSACWSLRMFLFYKKRWLSYLRQWLYQLYDVRR